MATPGSARSIDDKCIFHSPHLRKVNLISRLAAADISVFFTDSLVFFAVGVIPLSGKNKLNLLEPLTVSINSIY